MRCAPPGTSWPPPSAACAPCSATPCKASTCRADPPAPGFSLDDPGLVAPEAIAADALVVLMGGFGALTSAEIGADWRALLERLRAAGHQLLLVPLCPLARTALPAGTLLLAPLDPATPGSDRQREALALEALLCALARTWLPDRRRLRALRQAIPAASLHTELCAYNHPRIGRDAFRLWLRPDSLLPWLRRVEQLPAALRARLQAAIDQSGAGLDANARAVERLQADLIRPGPPAHYRRVAEQAREAAASLDAGGGMGLAQFSSMLPVIAALRHRPDWRAVVQQADQVARAAGGAPISPASGFDRAASHGLHPLGAGLEVRAGTGGLLAIAADAYSVERGPLVDGPPLTDLQALEIYDRDHRWCLEAISRPSWAERIWSDGTTLFAAHADNALFAWRPAAPDRPEGLWQPEHNPWPWAAEIGVDRFGLWARLEVRGRGQGKVSAAQRLRWIPPGRFLMGSPEDEPDHQADERLHPVTLTRGYWLGDTAVSQALWRAVTGQNPSHFQGDDLPVETVSWEDCQGFLARLAELAPGLLPALPTEAQWEHACRAGTRTPFSFGERLDPELANYDGNYPYNGAPKGLYRQKTLAVQHFEPNPWGLYQMHGNVWEWCADWLGAYPDGPAQDPVGAEQGRGRVLRGGSWYFGGRATCAPRAATATRRTNRSIRYIGLRLAGGFDPQAGPAGQARAGAMTADDREQSDRALGGQGVGEGAAGQGGAGGGGVIKALRDRLLPKRWR
jgi:sulfatase modifying factor 1